MLERLGTVDTDPSRRRRVEIDPAVWHAAHHYFGLRQPARLELADGAKSIEDRAAAIRTAGQLLRPRDQTDYVIHDCFTGGSVPAELFTKEFWWDLTMTMKSDGVLVVVSVTCRYHAALQAISDLCCNRLCRTLRASSRVGLLRPCSRPCMTSFLNAEHFGIAMELLTTRTGRNCSIWRVTSVGSACIIELIIYTNHCR